MHRIDNSSAVATMPPRKPVGTPGYFSLGDRTVGQLATAVEADILNAMMMEIANVITNAGITLSKTDDAQLWQAINTLVGALGLTVIHDMFTTSATYTPNAKMRFCAVEIWGGGGGGGGAFGQPASNVSAATGGASGAYAMRLYSRADIGAGGAAVAIGAGGAAAPAGQNNGNSGGATTFATTGTGGTMQANGGGGGQYGITATTPTRGGFLAASPASGGGHIMVPGTPGSWPLLFGGSAAYAAISGSGGQAPMFASGGGQSAQEDAAGNPGTYFGGGGAGGAATTVSRAGGAGFQGLCRVVEYCF
jgi:hypothetical protein